MFGMRKPAAAALFCVVTLLPFLLSCWNSNSITPPDSPACSLSATGLDFGPITVGHSADRTFTITNSGGGTLVGTVLAGSAPWHVVGTATYSLGAGKSATFTVRCTPTQADTLRRDIAVGASDCGPVHCAAVAQWPSACQLAPTTLDFGTVVAGHSAERTFTITNTGGSTLSGAVSAPCAGYSILGPTTYSLSAGQTDTVRVRFAPTTDGTWNCAISTGIGCDAVRCTGIGQIATACWVDPTALDFGTVAIGQYADRTFTISNTGGGNISGTVSSPCAAFSIVGSATYSLGPAEIRTFTVRFTPTGSGSPGLAGAWRKLVGFGRARTQARQAQGCVISTGTGLCSGVTCVGTGEPPADPPVCHIFGTSLDFGAVTVGQSADRTFTITNTGGGTLSGTVSASCIGYAIVGNPSYSLGADQTATFTVRFAPPNAGTRTCTISTGTGCGSVGCTGTGQVSTACQVSPTSLDFGMVTVGQSADRSFTITNTGGGSLVGSVSLQCPPYSIVGSSVYNLGAGQSQTFTVRFAPTAAGSPGLAQLWKKLTGLGKAHPQNAAEQICPIWTGLPACGTVGATGTGVLPTATLCRVSPAALNFGTVTVGYSTDRVVTVTNLGQGALTGPYSCTCPEFTVVSPPASIAPGESAAVAVRFTPKASGSSACQFQVGQPTCSQVSLAGNGYLHVPAACALSITNIHLNQVFVGIPFDTSFVIRSVGGDRLIGTLDSTYTGTYDSPYVIQAKPGSFSIAPGDSQVIRITISAWQTGHQGGCSFHVNNCGHLSVSVDAAVTAPVTLAPGYLSWPVPGYGWPVAGYGGLAIDSSGYFYVSNASTAQVDKYSPAGTLIASFGSPGTGPGQLSYPSGLAVGPGGVLYVSDPGNNRIQKWTGAGEFVSSFPTSGGGQMTMGSDQSLYLVSRGARRYSTSGVLQASYGSSQCETLLCSGSDMCCPTAVAVDSDGIVYLTGSAMGQVIVYGPGGTILRRFFPEAGPSALAIERSGNILVGCNRSDAVMGGSHYDSYRVVRYDPMGRPLNEWGGFGSGPGMFAGISAIAVRPDGYIYVLDSGNGRIQRFGPTQGFAQAAGSRPGARGARPVLPHPAARPVSRP